MMQDSNTEAGKINRREEMAYEAGMYSVQGKQE